jgi:hypothetical protein
LNDSAAHNRYVVIAPTGFHDRDRRIVNKPITRDEARRITANIA